MKAKDRQAALGVVALVAVGVVLMWMRSSYQARRHAADVVRARAVVQGQLEAFKEGDFQKAFSFAASGFHTGTLADFKKMVEDGYPQIAHPREFHLGQAHWEDDGAVSVEVEVTGRNGQTVPHVYAIARESDGWKVAGVSGGMPPGPPPHLNPAPAPKKRPSDPAATGSA